MQLRLQLFYSMLYTLRKMPLHISIYKKVLNFTFKAGTSRGYYTTKDTYIVKIEDQSGFSAYGECSTLPDLSCDHNDNYENVLKECAHAVMASGHLDLDTYKSYPSIIFGFETALLSLAHRSPVLFDSPFTSKSEPIAINGLIWMGDFATMAQRLESKINDGFKCIKIKIGAIDFDKELELLEKIRSRFDKNTIQIRVDANGAFAPHEATDKLKALSCYDLHSIEQPVKAGSYALMKSLCEAKIIPIALDEELIGVHDLKDKAELLDSIRPDYIVLKPSLHGGFAGCSEFIKLCRQRDIGFWLTSALESNIGLNAIAQYAFMHNITIPQGLGTGLLYSNNIDYPLSVRGEKLYFDRSLIAAIDYEKFLSDSSRVM